MPFPPIISRPHYFARFFCVAVGMLLCSSARAEKTNVLMICVDDLKPALGCYGDDHAITPNIDRLASRGVRFDAAYCNQAVCSPSRNSLMTGLRPQSIGVYDLMTHFRLAAPDATTMTQHFVQNGYVAEGLGKIFHVGHGNIDDARSWSAPSWRPKAGDYLSRESIAAIRPDNQGKKRGPATESTAVSDDDYKDGQIAIEAISRLRANADHPDQTFFLAVGFLKPHLPFVAPEKYWDLFDPNELPMPQVVTAPKDAPDFAKTSGGELRNYSDMGTKEPIDEATTRHLIHGYYAATSYVDAQIGRVLKALDELKLTDNTIVVLWGDHGWHLGDHGMWCKHTNYEQAARIPVIVSAPTGSHGAVSKSLVETVDLFPTIAELAGVDLPVKIDGQSFASVVREPASRTRDHVTHVYPRGSMLGRAIRDDRYRMVEWKKPGDGADAAVIELYDYQADPLETQNVAENEPDIVERMRAQLASQGEALPQWQATKRTGNKGTKTPAASASEPEFDRAAAFRRRDADQDGLLTMDEFMSTQPDPQAASKRFPNFDKNDDGKLSVDEYVNVGSAN